MDTSKVIIGFSQPEIDTLLEAHEILVRHKLDKTTNANITMPYSQHIQMEVVQRPMEEVLELTCNPLALICDYLRTNGAEESWRPVQLLMWYCPGIPKWFYADTEEEFRAEFKKRYDNEAPVAAYQVPFNVNIDHTDNDMYFELEAVNENLQLPTVDGLFSFDDDGRGGKNVSAYIETELENNQLELGNEEKLLAKLTEFGYDYVNRYGGKLSTTIFG